MPISVDDADSCQMCGLREPTQEAMVLVGGSPLGPLFVCDDCSSDGENDA